MKRLLQAASSGVLLTLLYAPFDVSLLGWIALLPLLLALRDCRPGHATILGWVTGTVGSLGVTGYWIYRASSDYFAMTPVPALAFTFLVNQFFVSLYFAAFGGLVVTVDRSLSRPFLVACCFVATEFLRATLFGGNPWAQLGQSQRQVVLLQICDLTGVYGLSFLLASSSACLASGRWARRDFAAMVGLIALVLVYGVWRIRTVANEPHATVPVALVQAALPNHQRGQPRYFAEHLKSYLVQTRLLAFKPHTLVVWPENAVGFFPLENAELLDPVREILLRHEADLLFGAPRAAGMDGQAALYNSTYLLSSTGLRSIYDKRVLLPFVESTPLRRSDGPYLAGEHLGLFELDSGKAGTLICYEAIYAPLARELARAGAGILMNLSNDSWFDAGSGPEQHFQAARFRAVENHVSLVRVTNSGLSGVVDPTGRILATLPSRTPAGRIVEVPIGAADSIYSRVGDVFAWGCVLIALASLVLSAQIELLQPVAKSVARYTQ